MARIVIRPARPDEHERLSQIAWAAKAHWGYDAADMAAWRESLTLTPASLAQGPARVVEVAGQVVAFGQLLPQGREADLDHLWVLPAYMGTGLGRRLLEALLHEAAEQGCTRVTVDADPFAEGFYLACGAVRVGECPAPLRHEPARVRPQLYFVPKMRSPASPSPGTM